MRLRLCSTLKIPAFCCELGPIYTKRLRQRQRCDDTSDTALIESNGVPPDWGCNPLLKKLHYFQLG